MFSQYCEKCPTGQKAHSVFFWNDSSKGKEEINGSTDIDSQYFRVLYLLKLCINRSFGIKIVLNKTSTAYFCSILIWIW